MCIQDIIPVKHLASTAIDVSDPNHPIFPHGVQQITVSKYIAVVLYDPDTISPAAPSLDSLRYGGPHTARVSSQAEVLKALVDAIRTNLAQGRYVIVRGWRPAIDMAWDDAAVEAFKGPLVQGVEYEGKLPSHSEPLPKCSTYDARFCAARQSDRIRSSRCGSASILLLGGILAPGS